MSASSADGSKKIMTHNPLPVAVTLALAAIVVLASPAEPNQVPEVVRTLCSGCHGVDGNGGDPARADYPKLAAKRSAYLKKQLKDYQTGKRKSAVMSPFATALSAQQIDEVSAHYARQTGRSATVTNSNLIEFGKKIYVEGNVESGVPACGGCHQPDASGDMRSPRLAGQHVPYTYGELKKFASGERDNDHGLVMQAVATRMTDEEMKAVSEYLTSLE